MDHRPMGDEAFSGLHVEKPHQSMALRGQPGWFGQLRRRIRLVSQAAGLGMLLLASVILLRNDAIAAESLEEKSDSRKPLSSFRDCEACPEMVVIPGGSFLIGSPDDDEERDRDEGPEVQVSISSFALGRYEVTRQEFAAFISETGHATGACVYWDVGFGDAWRTYDLDLHNAGHDHRPTLQHPVTCVSWHDAKAYVAWLKAKTGLDYRLPSEAEWAYAARAGTSSRYHWGDGIGAACTYANGHDETSQTINLFNWEALPCDDGHGFAAPVGSYRPNAFSLFDMTGNLWEWVEDHYQMTFEGLPKDGKPWLASNGSPRVMRGGSFESEPRDLRSANRIWSRADSRLNSNGFRVALTLPEADQ